MLRRPTASRLREDLSCGYYGMGTKNSHSCELWEFVLKNVNRSFDGLNAGQAATQQVRISTSSV